MATKVLNGVIESAYQGWWSKNSIAIASNQTIRIDFSSSLETFRSEVNLNSIEIKSVSLILSCLGAGEGSDRVFKLGYYNIGKEETISYSGKVYGQTITLPLNLGYSINWLSNGQKITSTDPTPNKYYFSGNVNDGFYNYRSHNYTGINAASITIEYSLKQSNFTKTGSITHTQAADIAWTKIDNAYYNLKLVLNGAEQYLIEEKSSNTSFTDKIVLEDPLLSKLKNTKSLTGTLELSTYESSSSTTAMGVSTINIIVRVPDYTTFETSPSINNIEPLSGFTKMTEIKFELSVGESRYGADIKKVELIHQNGYIENLATNVTEHRRVYNSTQSSSDKNYCSLKVTDSRGVSVTIPYTEKLNIYEYTSPSISLTGYRISEPEIDQRDDFSGKYIKIDWAATYNDKAENSITSVEIVISQGDNSESKTYSSTSETLYPQTEYNTEKDIIVTAKVTDEYSSYTTSLTIPKATFLIFFKKNKNLVCLGATPDNKDKLEDIYSNGMIKLGWPVKVIDSMNIDGPLNINGSLTLASPLSLANGGTGVSLSSSPSMLVDLGSTSSANIFQESSSPGIKGTLPITHGGTGATSAADARTKLGITLANLGGNNASNLTTGTLSKARLPFKYAWGSSQTSGNSSHTATLNYSSAGFSSVPYVFVQYSKTGNNNSTGSYGVLKVYNKTTTSANVIATGSDSNQRPFDWFAIGD